MSTDNKQALRELEIATMLQINERLYENSMISKSMYDRAKEKIIKAA